MKKYLKIISIFVQRSLTYRFSVVAYRVGEIVETLVLILLWTAIYQKQELFGGLTLQEMITYVLLGTAFHVATRAFGKQLIANEIKDGLLSTFLVKPLSYLQYDFFRGIGRIIFVSGASVVTQLLVILFFLDKILINTDIKTWLVILPMLFLNIIIEFLLSHLIALIAFWTDEVNGIFDTFDSIKDFFAGGYFPLSLLPVAFVQVSFMLPFAYTFFIPAQIYLGKIELMMGIKGLGVQAIWIGILYILIKIVWKRGLRRYEGIGI